MKIYLQTLTPVHIGTGEELFALDYVLRGDRYYRVSQQQFLEFLMAQSNPEALLDQYSEWIVNLSDRIANLREDLRGTRDRQEKRDYNQQLSRLQQSLNLQDFARKVNLQGQFAQFLRTAGIRSYHKDSGLPDKRLQVRGMMTTGDGRPFLPGTSLKGSIRTALLFAALRKHGQQHERQLSMQLVDEANQRGNKRKIAARMGKRMEQTMAYGGIEKKGKLRYDDVQQDVFKFLYVSDAHLEGKQTDPVEVVKTDLYLVTNTSRDPKKRDYKATKQRQSPSIEAIKPGTILTCEVDIKVDQMVAILRVLKVAHQRKEWVAFEEKIERIFGIQLSAATDYSAEMVQTLRTQALTHLQTSLTAFAKQQQSFDKTWVEERYLTEKLDTQTIPFDKKVFRSSFEDVLAYPFQGRSLLRTGLGGGFANKTELLYMLERPELKRAFSEVMLRLGIGNSPMARGAYKPNVDKFPKSRTLVSRRDSIAPLGWIEWVPADKDGKMPKAAARSQQASGTAAKKVTPQYPPAGSRIKVGTVVDAYVFPSSSGRQKKIRLYLGKGKDQDVMLNFAADSILGKIIQVEISQISKETVQNVRFKQIKK